MIKHNQTVPCMKTLRHEKNTSEWKTHLICLEKVNQFTTNEHLLLKAI